MLVTGHAVSVSTHLVTKSKSEFESAFERQAEDIFDTFCPYKFAFETHFLSM
jgi:hypothetical protein